MDRSNSGFNAAAQASNIPSEHNGLKIAALALVIAVILFLIGLGGIPQQ